MAMALGSFGLQPGHVVGVEIPSFYVHWLIVLAFETLGVATFSYAKAEIHLLEDALATVDLVMCAPGGELPEAERTHFIDECWLESVFSGTPESPLAVSPVHQITPIRVIKSSGTTGSHKRMHLTRRDSACKRTAA